MPDTDSDLPRTLGAPMTRALAAAGYRRLDQLDGVARRELAALHGVGAAGLNRLQAALEERGQSLS